MTLAHSLVTAEGETPERWMLFLHGILGSRSNWRGVARRFVAAQPDWGAVLVDLREHGESRGLPPPHTVRSAAEDLVELETELEGTVRGVLGHSFGGKVALAYADGKGEALEELWVIDSNPGARPEARGSEGTVAVVDMLDGLPRRWSSREDFVQRIVEEEGHGQVLGQWLAMNLERTGDGFEMALDLDAVRALLDDYFAQDLWSVIEEPAEGLDVHLVIADRSTVFDPDDRKRARRAAQGRVQVHFVEADHWVHVEAPDALLGLLTA